MMARDIGVDVTETRLREYVEETCDPHTFGDEDDRFGFFFGWDETYPRSQQSALLMVPELGGRGAWSAWSGHLDRARFATPIVEGVDYPAVALSVARNDVSSGDLILRTYAATPSRTGDATRMRVVQIPEPDGARVTGDGNEFGAWRRVGTDAIELDLTIGGHSVVARTGHHGRGVDPSRARSAPPGAGPGPPVMRSAGRCPIGRRRRRPEGLLLTAIAI